MLSEIDKMLNKAKNAKSFNFQPFQLYFYLTI